MLNIFKNKYPKENWRITTPAPIWRLLFSDRNDLVLELRNKDEKTVEFAAFELETGKQKWGGLKYPDNWFCGLESVHSDFVFLHGYLDPNLPEHAGLLSASLESGTTLWINEKHTFYRFHHNRLFTYIANGDDRYFFELNPSTGEVLTEIGKNRFDDEDINTFQEFEGYADLQFPDQIRSGTDSYQSIHQALKGHLKGHDERAGFDCLEFPTSLLIGFHYWSDQKELNYKVLHVDSKTAKVTFSQILASELTGHAGDLFLKKANQLLVLSDHTRLTAYPLSVFET